MGAFTDQEVVRYNGGRASVLLAVIVLPTEDGGPSTGRLQLPVKVTAGDGVTAGANAEMNVAGPSGTSRTFRMLTGTANRWQVRASTTAESGADAGSNLQIVASADNGNQIDIPITIVRAAGGAITFARPVTFTAAVTLAGLVTAYVAKAFADTGYTVLATDVTVNWNTAGGACSCVLPTAVGCAGQIFNIRKGTTDANAVTISTTGGETIDGAATLVLGIRSNAQIQSDGANWMIL